MVIGGNSKTNPEFYPLTGSPLPECMAGEKAELPGLILPGSWAGNHHPVLIKDAGTPMFTQTYNKHSVIDKKNYYVFRGRPGILRARRE